MIRSLPKVLTFQLKFESPLSLALAAVFACVAGAKVTTTEDRKVHSQMIRGRRSGTRISGKSSEWFLTKEAIITQLKEEGSSPVHQLRASLLIAFNALTPFNEQKL